MASGSAALPTEPDSEGCNGAMVSHVNFRIVKSTLEEEVLSMQLERPMTPLEICTIWDKEWGVSLATRIKFEAPLGHGSKFLNPRSDIVPGHPAVIKLVAQAGAVLPALLLAAPKNGAAISASFDEVVGTGQAALESLPPAGTSAANKFSERLRKMSELRTQQLSLIEKNTAEFEGKLQADERFKRKQEEDQRKWEREQKDQLVEVARILEHQRRRKEQEQQWEQEQLRLQQQKQKEEELRERERREKLKQEEQEREEREREEREAQERKVRLAEVEKERKEREEQDPKFRDAMERRRTKQEQNRLRAEAQKAKVQALLEEKAKETEEVTSNRVVPAALPSCLREAEDHRKNEENRYVEESCVRDNAMEGYKTGYEAPGFEDFLKSIEAVDVQEMPAPLLAPVPARVAEPPAERKQRVFAIPKRGRR